MRVRPKRILRISHVWHPISTLTGILAGDNEGFDGGLWGTREKHEGFDEGTLGDDGKNTNDFIWLFGGRWQNTKDLTGGLWGKLVKHEGFDEGTMADDGKTRRICWGTLGGRW